MEMQCYEDKQKESSSRLGVRHGQTVMFFMALTLNLSIRASMSIAIVDMTDDTKDEYFQWPIKTQSVILSSFFWGYVVLQVPAGELAAKYGGKILLLGSVAGNSLLSAAIPPAAFYGGWPVVCACRIIQGLLQGWMLPSVHCLMAKWVPLAERSIMGAIVYGGCSFGLAFEMLISGYLAHALGWSAIFYVVAGIGFIWSIVYYIFGADCPENSKIISNHEKKFIQQSIGQVAEKQIKVPTPWKALFTSPAFLSLILVHIGFAWGMWTLMTEIPTYISKVLGVNIKNNGILSALPYVTMTVMTIPFGFLSEILLKKNLMNVTNTRKICNSLSLCGSAIPHIILSHVGTNKTVAIALLCVAVGMSAGHVTGFLIVHLDMAPNFAGTMMGITNGVACFFAMMGPLVTGALIKDDTNPSDWRKLFYLTAGMNILCNLVYVIFGTSKRQPWNEPQDLNTSGDKTKSIENNVSNIAVISA